MPHIVIDGIEYPYEPSADSPPLLEFAARQGVEIPYFCYHPAMSAPTNCRMCLVEVGFPQIDRATGQAVLDDKGQPIVNWGRKPATACNQALSPGMVVRTNRSSQAVDKAQKGVLEFLLVNHPLDCPICDQAGECPLQINTYKYGPEGSRFELSKVHKPKRIPLGPNVVLDAERCINCTRCTRFTEEISGSNQLTIIARGDKNFPATAPGESFTDPYSMNVIDLCPVGALTSDDFRFKARVWEMNYAPNICTGCSKGCSVNVWVRDNQVLRLTPRENEQVNQYWMCDEGRLDYHKYNERRVSGAKLKNDVPVSIEDGERATAQLLEQHKGKTLFIGSAHASIETNYVLKQLAGKFGAKDVYFATREQAGWGDKLLRQDDRTPNKAGCVMLGFKSMTEAQLLEEARKYSLVLVVEDDALAAKLAGPQVVALAYNYVENHAALDVLLPAATNFESAGVYINHQNVPQVTTQALQIKQMTPEMWMAMPKSRLDAGGVAVDNWRHPENIVDCLPGWMLLSRIAHAGGHGMSYTTHKEIFNKLHQEFDALKHVKISKRNRKESFKMSQLEFAIDLKR